MAVPDGCLTVGELIIELITFGEMSAPIVLLGEGWLQKAENDLGQFVLLHPQEESANIEAAPTGKGGE